MYVETGELRFFYASNITSVLDSPMLVHNLMILRLEILLKFYERYRDYRCITMGSKPATK
jgi:hypothetical protein